MRRQVVFGLLHSFCYSLTLRSSKTGPGRKSGTMIVSQTCIWGDRLVLSDVASDDVKNVDLTKVHNLSGPIAVEGAEPGDCLVVDILDITPFEKMPWGYTVRSTLSVLDHLLITTHRVSSSSTTAGDYSVNVIPSLPLVILNPPTAREFDSKAAKAIWDLHGQLTKTPTTN